MKNLINFFFSFDKLFKEKLVVPFFWLALIVMALAYSAEALDSIALDPVAAVIGFIGFFAELFLVLISIRIVSEIFVAIFRINDNLSPDGGKSELADIDPVGEARKAAEAAAARTREMTKTATDKALHVTSPKSTTPSLSDKSVDVKAKDAVVVETTATAAKPVTASATDGAVKRGRGRPKGSTNKATSKPTKTVAVAADGTTPVKRGRGRPKGSTNKTTKPKSSAAAGKRGPKKGQPIPRDADGNLLKKDGTPRKKPGPKA